MLDFSQLVSGKPSRRALGTRIVLIHWVPPTSTADQTPWLMGLLVEQITEMLQESPLDSVTSNFKSSELPYLGRTLLYAYWQVKDDRFEVGFATGFRN
ncbi:MAG: hypothetical protein AAFQ63_07545 [Cyanobacteria bacterium J06621_11]